MNFRWAEDVLSAVFFFTNFVRSPMDKGSFPTSSQRHRGCGNQFPPKPLPVDPTNESALLLNPAHFLIGSFLAIVFGVLAFADWDWGMIDRYSCVKIFRPDGPDPTVGCEETCTIHLVRYGGFWEFGMRFAVSEGKFLFGKDDCIRL
ncbi:hypothetical protein ACLOJK_024587 [Asimina triloba]